MDRDKEDKVFGGTKGILSRRIIELERELSELREYAYTLALAALAVLLFKSYFF